MKILNCTGEVKKKMEEDIFLIVLQLKLKKKTNCHTYCKTVFLKSRFRLHASSSQSSDCSSR